MNPYLTPALPERQRDWRDDARCRNRPEYWALESLPSNDDCRAEAARARCAPCLVSVECATWHLTQPNTVGMVVAGVMIEGLSTMPKQARRQLELVRDGVPVSELRPEMAVATSICVNPTCGRKMTTRTAFRNAGRPKWLRQTGAHGMCMACYQTSLNRAKKVAA